MNKVQETFENPGDIIVSQLLLISPNQGKAVDLRDYLIELNIYESMFRPGITGSVLLADSRNLVKLFPIIGEELLVIKAKTPTMPENAAIHKVFRIHALKNKTYTQDGNSQIYKLNFTSIELFRDFSNPIYRSFSGRPHDIVADIFREYLQFSRFITEGFAPSEDKTPLFLLDEAENQIKFVSPGWSPIQCINWLVDKSLMFNNSSNFMFWETTKGFYYGSTNAIFNNTLNVSIGNYVYSSSYVGSTQEKLAEKLVTINSLTVEKAFDQMSNNLEGYIASRLIDVNLYNKTYEDVDYDHGENFNRYAHTEGENSLPLFNTLTSRNPLVYKKTNYKYPTLYNNTTDNFSETEKFRFGNRRSNLLELDNFRMKISIPGRTDIESGNLINIALPRGMPATEEEKSQSGKDEVYSGYYLITSINHKINPHSHFITMNVSKDCLPSQYKYE